MQLSNGVIRVSFDDVSGCVTELRDLRTGEDHLPDTQHADLFRFIVPAEQWQSRYADAAAQHCRWETPPDAVLLHYDELVLSDATRVPINVEVRVELPAGSAEAYFSITVRNHSSFPIAEVCFPKLGGWTGYAGPGKDAFVAGSNLWNKPLDPHAQPIAPIWATFMRIHQRFAVRFPTNTFLPWVDVSGGGRGLSLINYMRQVRIGGIMIENRRGYEPGTSISFGWFCNPEIKPGQTWSLATCGVGLHEGDWHAAARRYREWLKTWWAPAPSAFGLRRKMAIQNVIFRSFDGEPVRSLDQIPAVAQSGLKYGVTDLCIWDYQMLGNYGRLYSATPTDYPADQWETLRNGLASAHQMGVRTSMLMNYRLTNPSSAFYKAGGSDGVIRMRDGSLRSEPVPTSGRTAEYFPFWMGPQAQVMCPKSQQFRQYVMDQLERLLDVGFDAFFIDQPFENMPCYADNHGHVEPGDTHEGAMELVRDFRARVLQQYPDTYFIGEVPEAFVGQFIDVWWMWQWSTIQPEIMLYSVPGMIHSYVTDVNFDHAQQGFLHGMLLQLTTHGLEGTLDDAPQFGDYVRRMSALRARTATHTSEAEFADVDDLTSEGCQAKRFITSTGANGVTIVNQTDAPAWARITVGNTRPAQMVLQRLDGRCHQAGRHNGDHATLEVRLDPRECAVWQLD